MKKHGGSKIKLKEKQGELLIIYWLIFSDSIVCLIL